MIVSSRRGFLIGLGAMMAAPAIVHAGNLMPVRALERITFYGVPIEFDDRYAALAVATRKAFLPRLWGSCGELIYLPAYIAT